MGGGGGGKAPSPPPPPPPPQAPPPPPPPVVSTAPEVTEKKTGDVMQDTGAGDERRRVKSRSLTLASLDDNSGKETIL